LLKPRRQAGKNAELFPEAKARELKDCIIVRDDRDPSCRVEYILGGIGKERAREGEKTTSRQGAPRKCWKRFF